MYILNDTYNMYASRLLTEQYNNIEGKCTPSVAFAHLDMVENMHVQIHVYMYMYVCVYTCTCYFECQLINVSWTCTCKLHVHLCHLPKS